MLENIRAFLEHVVQVWQTGFLGGDIGRALIAIGIFLIFVIIRRLFAKFLMSNLKLVAKRTKNKVDDTVIEAFHEPLTMVPLILGLFLAVQYFEPDLKWAAFFQRVILSMIAATIFWALHNAVDPVSHLTGRFERLITPLMMEWITKALRVLFILVGAAAVLEVWGIKVGPLLAGLGLFGVAVALGAQDLFKNLLAGLSILIERRFNRGDWVQVDGIVEGVVEQIGFRSTKVRRFDKAPVYVPNDKLSNNAVTNFSEMTHRRIYWKIGVVYDTTVDQLRQIRDGIEAYIHENEDFASPEEVSTFVRIDAFNDSSIDILIYCFTKTTKWGEWLEIKEAFAFAVKSIVLEAGSSFAFPSRSLYVETMPDELPSVLLPAAVAQTAPDS